MCAVETFVIMQNFKAKSVIDLLYQIGRAWRNVNENYANFVFRASQNIKYTKIESNIMIVNCSVCIFPSFFIISLSFLIKKTRLHVVRAIEKANHYIELKLNCEQAFQVDARTRQNTHNRLTMAK